MTTYWDDELEQGNTGYDFSNRFQDMCGQVVWGSFDTVNKVSGTGSLRLNFPIFNLPPDNLCEGFADRSFPATLDLWSRFYIRLEPGFTTHPVSTKFMNHSTSGIQSNWWGILHGGSEIFVTVQHYPIINSSQNFAPNVADGNVSKTNGQWYCIETREKLNTIGVADGVLEAYKNGVQFMNYTGLEFRKVSQNTQNNQFIFNRLIRQGGYGSINYDRLAMGNTRIGPITGGLPPLPPPPPTAPTQPTGLQVT